MPQPFGNRSIWIALAAIALLIIPAMVLLGIVSGGPNDPPEPPPDEQTYLDKAGDEELAYLLVKLEKRTRQVIAGHYGRSQSAIPGVDALYKRGLAKNVILPAAVAGAVFSEVVPAATGGRAWVKMVRREPRNPNNLGDSISLVMLTELQTGAQFAERKTPNAYYYGEPIKAKAGCLVCHGAPKGDPDPLFPMYKMEGWQVGDIIGGIIARVAPEE